MATSTPQGKALPRTTSSPVNGGPGSPVTGLKSNPLQNRVTAVLSASYADLDLRSTLAVLDERELHNTPEMRRNLRLDVQQEVLDCNGAIVQDFGRVAAQLQRVGAAIESLSTSCAAIRRHVDAARRETNPMLDEARDIISNKKQVETKQQLLSAFQSHFVVSDADLTTLTSSAEPVNDDFFRILTRVKQIHTDSRLLLGEENQRLGLEILEQSSRNLNAAFQKLHRWVQREFQSLDLENPQISAGIRRALRVLAERPSLFQHCLDSFAEAREHILSNNFYAALTGAPVDADHPVMGKAIELSAHDPLRYVSDMLAWAHAATVSEREALEVLFISEGDEIAKSIQAGIESEPWRLESEDGEAAPDFDGRKALNALVDRDLASVFRQLGQRVEQVLQSHEDSTLAYKIANLITFYTTIFASLLGSESTLLSTLPPLAETAHRAFRTITRDRVAHLRTTDLSLSNTDLAPPDFLMDALHTLQALMQSFDTSLTTNSTTTERSEAFVPVLQESLAPFLQGCETMSTKLTSPDDRIFALNCLLAAQETVSQHLFASRAAALEPRIEGHKDALTDVVHSWFISESGLSPLIEKLSDEEKRRDDSVDLDALAGMARQLDAFLPSATDDARSFLGQLEDRSLARRIVEDAAEQFCGDFDRIEGWVLLAQERGVGRVNGGTEANDDHEDEDEGGIREVFPRTADEIRVLLS